MNKEALLKSYWGFDAFKPLQEQIIDSVLSKKDTFALLPTGGGKSLCYQIPALMTEGFVLVISPLIALMEDQVNGLRAIGIKSMYFESTSKSLHLSKQLDNAIHGKNKIVYVSPERLSNPYFLGQIKRAQISLIAVDEAHCISEWGHDFRPAYRKINVLREYFPKTPVLALSASATTEVKKDVVTLLGLKSPSHFTNSFERPNLVYNVWNTEDKFNTVLQLLNHHKGSSIIYCYSRKQTQLLANFINRHQHRASYFHGGLLPSEKKQRLKDWQNGTVTHMVATTAFGMGIDKSNVRIVIHLSPPESIENYYQETGRAGRDGMRAHVFLLYHQGDLVELKKRIFDQFPNEVELNGIYKDLCNFFQIAYGEGQDRTYSLDLEVFCNRYQRSEKKLNQCLVQLEKTGILSWHASKNKQLRLQSKSSVESTLQYLKAETTSARVLEYVMRHHPDFFSDPIRVTIPSICSGCKISSDQLLVALRQLEQDNFIEFTGRTATLYLFFHVPREDKYTLQPVKKLLKNLKVQKTEKFNAIRAFIQDENKCKRNFLMAYFGETFKSNCNQCSSSMCQSNVHRSSDFRSKAIELLKMKPHSIQELKQKLYFEPNALEDLFSELLGTQKIMINDQHKYYWVDE